MSALRSASVVGLTLRWPLDGLVPHFGLLTSALFSAHGPRRLGQARSDGERPSLRRIYAVAVVSSSLLARSCPMLTGRIAPVESRICSRDSLPQLRAPLARAPATGMACQSSLCFSKPETLNSHRTARARTASRASSDSCFTCSAVRERPSRSRPSSSGTCDVSGSQDFSSS